MDTIMKLEDTKRIIKALTLSQMLLETLDSLEGTSVFKQEFKRRTYAYSRFLEGYTEKHIAHLYKSDEDVMIQMGRISEHYVDTNIEEILMN